MKDFFASNKKIQVTYADTDMMGIIYHANYIKWFEIGRTQLIEDVGYSYINMEKAGYCAPVYNLKITYKKAIKYGDTAIVKTWIEGNDGFKTTYGYHVINGDGEICAEGTTTHIIVRKDNFKPVQFKKVFPEWYQKYEDIRKK